MSRTGSLPLALRSPSWASAPRSSLSVVVLTQFVLPRSTAGLPACRARVFGVVVGPFAASSAPSFRAAALATVWSVACVKLQFVSSVRL